MNNNRIEVVRCSECIYFVEARYSDGYICMYDYAVRRCPNDYCSRAVRIDISLKELNTSADIRREIHLVKKEETTDV